MSYIAITFIIIKFCRTVNPHFSREPRFLFSCFCRHWSWGSRPVTSIAIVVALPDNKTEYLSKTRPKCYPLNHEIRWEWRSVLVIYLRFNGLLGITQDSQNRKLLAAKWLQDFLLQAQITTRSKHRSVLKKKKSLTAAYVNNHCFFSPEIPTKFAL